METTSRQLVVDILSFALVLLFIYTGSTKLMGLDDFSDTLKQMPLIGTYHVFLAYSIPISQIITGLLLIIPSLNNLGLRMAFGLLIAFTVFLTYMVCTVEFLPCNCGGVSALMSWNEHIFFNIAFIVVAGTGLRLSQKRHLELKIDPSG